MAEPCHVCVYKRLVSLLAATAKAFVSEEVSAGCRRGNQILLGSCTFRDGTLVRRTGSRSNVTRKTQITRMCADWRGFYTETIHILTTKDLLPSISLSHTHTQPPPLQPLPPQTITSSLSFRLTGQKSIWNKFDIWDGGRGQQPQLHSTTTVPRLNWHSFKFSNGTLQSPALIRTDVKYIHSLITRIIPGCSLIVQLDHASVQSA